MPEERTAEHSTAIESEAVGSESGPSDGVVLTEGPDDSSAEAGTRSRWIITGVFAVAAGVVLTYLLSETSGVDYFHDENWVVDLIRSSNPLRATN